MIYLAQRCANSMNAGASMFLGLTSSVLRVGLSMPLAGLVAPCRGITLAAMLAVHGEKSGFVA
jgi:hypothetical protein